MMEKKASWRPNRAAPGPARRNARGPGGTIGGVQKRQKLEDIGRYWKRIVRTAKFDTPSWPWEVAGGLPPPRGITAARPPLLPLRLDAWARLRGILGRLRGILGRLGTSKNAIESKTDFNIENEAKMKRPESPPESRGVPRSPAESRGNYFLGAKTAFETALVLHHIFNALFLRSELDFPSQLGSQNPPKSKKNRCQDAFPS